MKSRRALLSFPDFDKLLRALNPFMATSEKTAEMRRTTVQAVDLKRFVGAWRVQGHTPLVIDADSSNQVESYTLREDGKIDVTYRFKRFGRNFTLHPQAEVANKRTNAHWIMRFFRVFPSDYLIVRLADDYQWTVVSVPNKKLIWIMSRDVKMLDAKYKAIVEDLSRDGYAVENLRRVPQEA